MVLPRLFNINTTRSNDSFSDPRNFFTVGNSLYFSAFDGITGRELWRSDGRTTSRVADIYLGDLDSSPEPVKAIGNTLYFLATDPVSGRELWKTDGSTATRLADLYAGPAGSFPAMFAAIGNTLYFTADSFSTGVELWKTDGISTTLVEDIRVGRRSSEIKRLTVLDNSLLVAATNGSTGVVLWKTNGTGVTQISTVTPGNSAVVGKTYYFTSGNSSTGVELWKSDGTTSTPLPEINPGRESSAPEALTPFGENLIFTAFEQQTGRELWKTDGVTTTLLADARLGTGGSFPSEFNIAGTTLYFTAFSSINGGRRELWSTDGTTTQRLIDIRPVNSVINNTSSSPFAVVGDTLYFRRYESSTGSELWKAKGNTVSRVSDLFPGPASSNPDWFIAAGRTLFFTAQTPRRQLWKTDGTTTTLVADIDPNPRPGSFKLTKNALYFTAFEQDYGEELWSTDGFTTARVADINSVRFGVSGSGSSSIADLNVAGNTLFFTANDGRNGRELWALDLTAPVVSVSVPQTTIVVEGGSANTLANIKVSINAALFEDVSVSYATTDGTAKAGTDYTASAGTLLIPAGTKSATISIPIINNSTNDPNRSFTLKLSNPVNATLGTANATITISDTLFSSTSRTLPAGVENLTLTGASAINGTGNAGSNVLTGNSAGNVLRGLGGNDRLLGGFGIDLLDGGGGIDTADFSDRLNSVVLTLNGAGFATASVNGLAEDKVTNIENVTGGKGADTLIGDASANTLTGNDGNDTLRGGLGIDRLNGGNGKDTADFSDQLTPVVLTLDGANTVIATVNGLADDTILNIENITGGSAADTLNGDLSGNVLRGSAGNDTLNGSDGNDTLNGGAGADLLVGGSGNDLHVFRFQQSLLSAPDHISDLLVGSDRIDLFTATGEAVAVPDAFTRAADATATTLGGVVSDVFADANGLVNGKQPLGIRSAALVVAPSLTRTATYLIVNNAVAGFQSDKDLIIDITGYAGTLPGLGSISVSPWFV